ncbi:prolactin [Cricetulus griseus]|uniref:Prolactin n=1 Tax=Cricetulus griseus TaxID=10029 RepID=A0A9J7JMB0_CRIGR|nr:prolactin [Cricetulus griseus]XP_027265369.1 prolactin [Cricetulus griseus]
MQAHLNQPCSWMLQLLLVSNLLLWEYVVSLPLCLEIEGSNELTIEELFDDAIGMAQYTSNLTTQISEEFDENFAKSLGYKARNSSTCHTASLLTPENNEQIQQTQLDDLLKGMISISRAWYHPLEKLVHEVAALNGASETMLLKVKEVEEKNQELLKKIKEILVRVHPGAEENVYPAWMGLAEVRSANEDTRHFALSNIFRCLHSDTDKVATYLEIVKCRVIHNNNC